MSDDCFDTLLNFFKLCFFCFRSFYPYSIHSLLQVFRRRYDNSISSFFLLNLLLLRFLLNTLLVIKEFIIIIVSCLSLLNIKVSIYVILTELVLHIRNLVGYISCTLL